MHTGICEKTFCEKGKEKAYLCVWCVYVVVWVYMWEDSIRFDDQNFDKLSRCLKCLIEMLWQRPGSSYRVSDVIMDREKNG